jgi:hypothetical protein
LSLEPEAGLGASSDHEPSQRVAQSRSLGSADLTLVGVPSPADTTLEVLVYERECASGQSAEGRIELVDLTLTAEQILLHIGIRALEGDQDCQGNPPTPFTVDLGERIGDREIVDSSVVPTRPLGVDDTE